MRATCLMVLFVATTVACSGGSSGGGGADDLLDDPVGEWVWLGGPTGGLGYDIRMHPDDPDIMYVTDALAGVFKSTDGGAIWSPINTGITARSGESNDTIPAFCVTIDPVDPNIVWAGTLDQRGVYKSTDAGATWTKKEQGIVEETGVTFRGFAVDPWSSNIVYAAGEIASWAWAGEERRTSTGDMTQGFVYRSTDGGENWTAIWRGDNLARYVLIDPTDSNTLYVSTGIFDRDAANSGIDGTSPGGEGVLKSTDGGTTFTAANNGLENLFVGSLVMHPSDPQTLLAGTGAGVYLEDSGIYLTTDGAATWQHVFGEDTIVSVEFAPSDPNVAYAGSFTSVYRSDDGGQNWVKLNTGDTWGPPNKRAGHPIDFQVDPIDPFRAFANNYGGGNFLTTDGGVTWSDASGGYTGAGVLALTVDADEPYRFVAGVHSGIYLSEDAGQSWTSLKAQGGWQTVAFDPSDGDHIIAATGSGVLQRSTDGGTTWSDVLTASIDVSTWRGTQFVAGNPSIVYTGLGSLNLPDLGASDPGGGGLYRSVDGGATWSAVNDATSADANFRDLAVSPDGQTVYAATSDSGMLKTTNAGTAWSEINTGLPSSMFISVACSPSNPQLVLAGTFMAGFYRSTDGGTNWTAVATGVPAEATIRAIVFSPLDANLVYAADSRSGAYRSLDGGATWELVNTGLLNRSILSLAFSADGRILYAGTDGSGAYRMRVFE